MECTYSTALQCHVVQLQCRIAHGLKLSFYVHTSGLLSTGYGSCHFMSPSYTPERSGIFRFVDTVITFLIIRGGGPIFRTGFSILSAISQTPPTHLQILSISRQKLVLTILSGRILRPTHPPNSFRRKDWETRMENWTTPYSSTFISWVALYTVKAIISLLAVCLLVLAQFNRTQLSCLNNFVWSHWRISQWSRNMLDMPDMSGRLLLMSGRELRPCQTFCQAGFNTHKMSDKENKDDLWY